MATSDEGGKRSVRSAADLVAIVGDTIEDIAAFTLEKYEFKHDTTLSDEIRKEGNGKIQDALSRRAAEIRQGRLQVLAEMFTLAENAFEEAVNKAKSDNL